MCSADIVSTTKHCILSRPVSAREDSIWKALLCLHPIAILVSQKREGISGLVACSNRPTMRGENSLRTFISTVCVITSPVASYLRRVTMKGMPALQTTVRSTQVTCTQVEEFCSCGKNREGHSGLSFIAPDRQA